MAKEIETHEIYQAIRTANKKKNPGLDGLSYEFYEQLFDVILKELNLIRNEVLNQKIPPQFVKGIIILIPTLKKESQLHGSMDSLRPITRLNCDYKIFSRILKLRLIKTIAENKLLTTAQKCCNSQENILVFGKFGDISDIPPSYCNVIERTRVCIVMPSSTMFAESQFLLTRYEVERTVQSGLIEPGI